MLPKASRPSGPCCQAVSFLSHVLCKHCNLKIARIAFHVLDKARNLEFCLGFFIKQIFNMLVWIFLALCPYVLSINEVCPGGSYTCPDTATCCELADKSYGCCPLTKAVCCDDHIHCCPQSTKCEAGICIQLDKTNITAKKLTAQDKDIICYGSEFVCPDNTTCCRGQTPGTYGCCPMEHAVCCSDFYHCCPEGTFCDLQEEKCVGKGFISDMYDSQKNGIHGIGFSNYLSLKKPNNVTSVVCPGGSFQCPDGYTCCQLPGGNWGCCPYVQAECCADHLHCCPQHMTCDATSQKCVQGQISVPSSLKRLSEPVNTGITCPDNSTCAESMTCCELVNKHFGCCPYPNAVCCGDLSHCCPNDYLCDDVEKRCVPKQKRFSNFV